MTVSNVSSTLSSYPPDTQSPWKRPGQDFKALQSALQSGDLTGAQQAFATLQQDQQNAPHAAKGPGASALATQVSQDFQALQSALSSGDLSGAKQAFATLKQDLQGAGRSRHAHHHHGGVANTTTPTTTSTTAPTDDSSTSTPSTDAVSGTLDLQA